MLLIRIVSLCWILQRLRCFLLALARRASKNKTSWLRFSLVALILKDNIVSAFLWIGIACCRDLEWKAWQVNLAQFVQPTTVEGKLCPLRHGPLLQLKRPRNKTHKAGTWISAKAPATVTVRRTNNSADSTLTLILKGQIHVRSSFIPQFTLRQDQHCSSNHVFLKQ